MIRLKFKALREFRSYSAYTGRRSLFIDGVEYNEGLLPAGEYDCTLDIVNSFLELNNSSIGVYVGDVLSRYGQGFLYSEQFLYNIRGERIIGYSEFKLSDIEARLNSGIANSKREEYLKYVEEFGLTSKLVSNSVDIDSGIWYDAFNSSALRMYSHFINNVNYTETDWIVPNGQ